MRRGLPTAALAAGQTPAAMRTATPIRAPRVLYIITGLDVGGAEAMLLKLLERLDRSRIEPLAVISLTTAGPIAARIEALGIAVRALGLSPGRPNPWLLLRLRHWLRVLAPDLVHTWMYHADLLGGLAARAAGAVPVIWCLRNESPRGLRPGTALVVRAAARLSSRLPARIVSCSERAAAAHVAAGYAAAKMSVIPNGFDLGRFRNADESSRAATRKALGVADDACLIGMVARFHPQKDHAGLILAIARLRQRHPNLCLLLCGEGLDAANAELAGWIAAAGLAGRVLLLGRRDDVDTITAALDIAVLSSAYGEAFPNVIGEAMACGVPCVVTDVGDSAAIVGDTGCSVPPCDPAALADAVGELVGLDVASRRALGRRARQRVETHYRIESVVQRYEALYADVAASQREPV